LGGGERRGLWRLALRAQHLKGGRPDLDRVSRAQHLGALDAPAVHERSVRGPEILDRKLIPGAPGDPRVAPRDLRIVAELSFLVVRGAPDQELAVELDLLASRLASDYAQ
jgi:hypothetical protein